MRPKPSRPRDVIRLATSLGFVLDRAKGSHRIYKHVDGRRIIVAFHPGDIPTGTLKNIIAMMGLTVEEFNRKV